MASTINSTTSSGVVITSDNTGQLQLQSAGTTVMTITSTGVTTQVGAPAFSAYQSSGQSLTGGVNTKITFTTELWDTNSNFASSRFTPTVAGYYQINGAFQTNETASTSISINKNGSVYVYGSYTGVNGAAPLQVVSSLIYFNGSTDYVEIYGFSNINGSTNPNFNVTYFNGFLARSA
jgi:hypothetical protein